MKKIFATAFILIIGLGISIGLSYVNAATFTGPTSQMGTNSPFPPVNTGIVSQIKNGPLSVDTFLASKDASFDQYLFLKDMVRGGLPTDVDSTVYLGGVVGNAMRIALVTIQGTLTAQDSVGSSDLANTTYKELCADATGKITFCNVGFASAGVFTVGKIGFVGGYVPIPPGYGGSPCLISCSGSFGAGPGYDTTVTVCLPQHPTQDESVVVKWKENGNDRQMTATIFEDQTKNYGTDSLFGFVTSAGDPQRCSKPYVIPGTLNTPINQNWINNTSEWPYILPTVSNICISPSNQDISVDPLQTPC